MNAPIFYNLDEPARQIYSDIGAVYFAAIPGGSGEAFSRRHDPVPESAQFDVSRLRRWPYISSSANSTQMYSPSDACRSTRR